MPADRTCLRLGEARALQWQDIDFNSRFILVRHTRGKKTLTSPKSGKQRRVDMSTKLTETLKTLLVERKKDALRNGVGGVPPWVFISTKGTPVHAENFRNRIWFRLLPKAGLRRIRILDLRHTLASLLLEQGESLAYVKEQLGYHSIRMTVDTYGHLVPGGNKEAVDKLDGLEDATNRNLSATTASNRVSKKR